MNYSLEDFKNELNPYFNFGELYGSVWLLSDGTTLPSYMKNQSKGTLHDELLDNLNDLHDENMISEECVRYFNDKVVDDFHCIQLNSRECCIRLFRPEISSSEWWTIYDWIEFFISSHHNDPFEVTWENKEGTANWSTIRPSDFQDDPDAILKHIKRLFTHKEIYQEELNFLTAKEIKSINKSLCKSLNESYEANGDKLRSIVNNQLCYYDNREEIAASLLKELINKKPFKSYNNRTAYEACCKICKPTVDKKSSKLNLIIGQIDRNELSDVTAIADALYEGNNNYRRIKRALWGDPLSNIVSFAIISVDNPLGWKDSTEKEFQDKYALWTREKYKFNDEMRKNFKADIAKDNIIKCGDNTLRIGRFNYVPILGKFDGNIERSYMIFNICQSDAETIARQYGQLSFFYGHVYKDKTVIEYYQTNNGCITYDYINRTSDVTLEDDSAEEFSKYGFKYTINPEIFTKANKVENEDELKESFNNDLMFKGRCYHRVKAYERK